MTTPYCSRVKYKDQAAKARVFPTPKLAEVLWSYFLEIEQAIEPPYLIINEGKDGWEDLIDLPSDHPEKQELATINEFLKPHQWACKGPVPEIQIQCIPRRTSIRPSGTRPPCEIKD